MKKTLAALALVTFILMVSTAGFGQVLAAYLQDNQYNTKAFTNYTLYSFSAVTATGSQAVSVGSGPYGAGINTPGCYIPTQGFGGITWTPIMVGNQVRFLDANAEVVTITSASASPNQTCTFTATFANTHNAGAPIISGSNGYYDAVTFAGVNGGGVVNFSFSELDTLSTGGTTTNTTNTYMLPANSFIDGVIGTVNTTITGGCTGWQLGDPTTAGRFTASNTTLTAGTQSVGSVAWTTGVASATTGFWQSANASLRITCATAAPSAGVVRVSVFGRTIVPSIN